MYRYGFIFKEETVTLNGFKGDFTVLTPDTELLRKQREAMGLTQQQVATESQINLRQYQRYESGERSLRTASLRIGANICHTLKIDPLFFSDFKDFQSPQYES